MCMTSFSAKAALALTRSLNEFKHLLGANLRKVSVPSRAGATLIRLTLQKPEVSTGFIDPLGSKKTVNL